MHVWPLYAGMAVTAAVISWRNPEIRPVGLAVLASWAASNAAHLWLAAVERPAAYTVAETMVLSMAFIAHVCRPSRLLVLLVAICIVSIGLNIYATMTNLTGRPWELATNLCFATECALVVITATYDRTRAWFDNGRAGVAFHGGSPASEEAKR